MNNQSGGYIRSDGNRIYAGKKRGEIGGPGPKAEAQLWNYLIDQKKLNIATISNHKIMQTNYIQWLTAFTEEIKPGTSFFNEPLGLIIPHILADEYAYILLNSVVSKRIESDASSSKRITNSVSETGHTISWLKNEFNTYDGVKRSKDQDIKSAHEAYKLYAAAQGWTRPSLEDFTNSWNHYSHKQFTQKFIDILNYVNQKRPKDTDLSSKKSKKGVSTSIVNKSTNDLLRQAEKDKELREQEQLEEATLKLLALEKEKKKLQKTLREINMIEDKEAHGAKINDQQQAKKDRKDAVNSELITIDKEITEIYNSFPRLNSKRSNSNSGSDTTSTSISSGKTKKNPKSRTKKKRKNTRKKSIK
jgi:hypothetical protein